VSHHSLWRAGRATRTLWSVYSEQTRMPIFRKMWEKVVAILLGAFNPKNSYFIWLHQLIRRIFVWWLVCSSVSHQIWTADFGCITWLWDERKSAVHFIEASLSKPHSHQYMVIYYVHFTHIFHQFQVPVPLTLKGCSVPLRTGTCYTRDIFMFLQDYCALQESLMKRNFTIAVASPFVHPMMSIQATPTHSVRKYGFFSEPTRWRQVAKYGNLKCCESLSFSGDIESLEPSKF